MALVKLHLGFVHRWEKWRKLSSFFAELFVSFGVIILAIDLAIFANQELAVIGAEAVTLTPVRLAKRVMPGLVKRLAPLLDALGDKKDRVRLIVTLDSNENLSEGRLRVVEKRRESLWRSLVRAILRFITCGFAGKKGTTCLYPELSKQLITLLAKELEGKGFRSLTCSVTSEADACLAAQSQIALNEESDAGHTATTCLATTANDFLGFSAIRHRLRNWDNSGNGGVTDFHQAASPLNPSVDGDDACRELWGALFFDSLAPPEGCKPKEFGFFRAAKVIRCLSVRKPLRGADARATATEYVGAIKRQFKNAVVAGTEDELITHITAAFVALCYPTDLNAIEDTESLAAAYTRIYGLQKSAALSLASLAIVLLRTAPPSSSGAHFPHIEAGQTLVQVLLHMNVPAVTNQGKGSDAKATTGSGDVMLSPLEAAARRVQDAQRLKANRDGDVTLTRREREQEALDQIHRKANPMTVLLSVKEGDNAAPQTQNKTPGREKGAPASSGAAAAAASEVPNVRAAENKHAAQERLKGIQKSSSASEFTSVTMDLVSIAHGEALPFLLQLAEDYGSMCKIATTSLALDAWTTLTSFLTGSGCIVASFTENSIREYLTRGRADSSMAAMSSTGLQPLCRAIFASAQANAKAHITRHLRAALLDSISNDSRFDALVQTTLWARVQRLAVCLLTPFKHGREESEHEDEEGERERERLVVSMDALRAAFNHAATNALALSPPMLRDLWEAFRGHFLHSFSSGLFVRYFPTARGMLTNDSDRQAVAEMASRLLSCPQAERYGYIGARFEQAARLAKGDKPQTRAQRAAKMHESAPPLSQAMKTERLLKSLEQADTLQALVTQRPELALALAHPGEPPPNILPQLSATHPVSLCATSLAHVVAHALRTHCSKSEIASTSDEGDEASSDHNSAVDGSGDLESKELCKLGSCSDAEELTEVDAREPADARGSEKPNADVKADALATGAVPMETATASPSVTNLPDGLRRWATKPTARARAALSVDGQRRDAFLDKLGSPADAAVRAHFESLAEVLEWRLKGHARMCTEIVKETPKFLAAVGCLLQLDKLPFHGQFLQSFDIDIATMEVRVVLNNSLLRIAQRKEEKDKPPRKRAATAEGTVAHLPAGIHTEDDICHLLADKDVRERTVCCSIDPGAFQSFATLCLAKDVVEDKDGEVTATTSYLAQRLSSGWYHDLARTDLRRRNREQAAFATSWRDLHAIDSHSARLAEVKARARGEVAVSIDDRPSERNFQDFQELLGRKASAHRKGAFQTMLTRLFHKAAAVNLNQHKDDPHLSKFNLVFLVGDARFATSRGGRRFPFAAFKSFLARFFPVVEIGEFMTSQTCVRGHFMGKAKRTTSAVNKRRSNCYLIRCKTCDHARHQVGKCHPNGHDKDRTATLNFYRKALCLAAFTKVPLSLLRK